MIGGTAKTNRKIALNILTGKDRSVKRDVVLLNAAALLYIGGLAKNLNTGVRMAAQSIDSKNAYNVLLKLREVSRDSK